MLSAMPMRLGHLATLLGAVLGLRMGSRTDGWRRAMTDRLLGRGPGAMRWSALDGRRGLAGLLLGLLPLLATPCGRAALGGPDTYGYTWRDGAEPGVSFAW